MADGLPFNNGEYSGEGRWTDQKTEGTYTAKVAITEGRDGAKIHTMERVFFNPDGTVAYEEHSKLTFKPTRENYFDLTITYEKQSFTGIGYCFENQCHYDMNISADIHLEFTFTITGNEIIGLGSSTNKGNFTSWKESMRSKN